MRTYCVQDGDSLQTITRKTGVEIRELKMCNPCLHDRNPAPGDVLYLTSPQRIFRCHSQEPLSTICARFHLSLRDFLRLNPSLCGRARTRRGETIAIGEVCEGRGCLLVCGEFHDERHSLHSLLPILPYLSFIAIGVKNTPDGKWTFPQPIFATRLLRVAREYGVLPFAHVALSDPDLDLRKETLSRLSENFEGIIFSLPTRDLSSYFNSLSKSSDLCRESGLSVRLKISGEQLVRDSRMWSSLPQICDGVFVTLSPTDPVATLDALTDIFPQRQRALLHPCLPAQTEENRAVKQRGQHQNRACGTENENRLYALLDRVAYGKFGGVSIPVGHISKIIYPLLRNLFHLQTGYRTTSPRFSQ